MPGKTFTLPSFAKINLYLKVLGKRDDGFHELCTVFQTVSLHDRLTFEENEKLLLTCDDPSIPAGGENLIIKAAGILRDNFGVAKGARIHLEKKIPAPGGLGGGSSNAAVALLGLAKLWEIKITPEELTRMGRELGSDVPFFFHGGRAIGTGRGEEITPIDQPAGQTGEKYLLIVTPDVDVSTREAFAGLKTPRLTPEALKSNLIVCRFEAETLDLRHTTLINDFEKSVFETAPEIRRVKERLQTSGAARVLMSGSGASVFGIFDTQETRQATLKAIDNEKNWRKFAVAAISRDEYREALKEVY
jgi:4-diphosphocytidyl-2-C-methyl-D-erythritol kinase